MGTSVTVIIPVYNEQRHLKKCLDSIFAQVTKPMEIIVVDDGSTDNSVEIVNKYNNICLMLQKHKGPGLARNFGASAARGGILVFLDADMRYDKNYLRELVGPIMANKAGATFTKNEEVENLENRWARCWQKVTLGGGKERLREDVGKWGTTFRAIKAEWFDKSGGFEDFGYSDDASVLKKLGRMSLACDKAICYHYNPESLSDVFASARWMGRDKKNKGKCGILYSFFPILAMIKGIIELVIQRNATYAVFRVVFDTGFWCGAVDANLRGVVYK